MKILIPEVDPFTHALLELEGPVETICSYCKSVRDDQNYWQKLESYFAKYSDVQFNHGICPDCYRDVVIPEMAAMGIDLDNPKYEIT